MPPLAAQRHMKMCAVENMVPMSAREEVVSLWRLSKTHMSMTRMLSRHNELLHPI